MTGLIYWANVASPPAIKLGLFYLVPVVLATWYEGAVWGVLYSVVSMVLRMQVELEQEAGHTTVAYASYNQLSFAVVAGVALFAFLSIRRNETLLRDLAGHDPLTGVANSRTFADRLAAELRRNRRYGRPVSMLYLDLDDFKIVNDTFGHPTGDAVLRLVADTIARAVRQPDVVGRLGGDEFAVLMPETDAAVAEAVAQRLAVALREGAYGGPTVTASIGVVSPIRPASEPDAVVRRADQAMYEAKRQGKNRVVLVPLEV